jgi:glutathione S-transferase
MDDNLSEKVYCDTESALTNWLSGIEIALTNNDFLCGDALTLADICFCCELLLLQSEHQWIESITELGEQLLSSKAIEDRFPRSLNHYEKLSERTDFSPDIKDHRAKIKSGQKIYD